MDINARGECLDVPSILSYAKELVTAGHVGLKRHLYFEFHPPTFTSRKLLSLQIICLILFLSFFNYIASQKSHSSNHCKYSTVQITN